jgi:hypothetical protein
MPSAHYVNAIRSSEERRKNIILPSPSAPLPPDPLPLPPSNKMNLEHADGIRKIWNKVTQTKHTVGIGKNTLANAALWIFGLLS